MPNRAGFGPPLLHVAEKRSADFADKRLKFSRTFAGRDRCPTSRPPKMNVPRSFREGSDRGTVPIRRCTDRNAVANGSQTLATQSGSLKQRQLQPFEFARRKCPQGRREEGVSGCVDAIDPGARQRV